MESLQTYHLYDGTDVISEFADYSATTYTSGTTPAQAPAYSVSLMLYQFSDHLTTRMSADNFASNASFEGHYPFGETWYDTGMACPSITKKFTSYNKDTEASSAFLNYAVHRQHSARLGRFHMADPVHGGTSNPQSLNRFSYGLGDPINNIDPTGLFNFKVEIPADWPCNPADNVACGCDPFESPFCGIGGSYPPSSSGGGGAQTSCKLTLSVSAPKPFCDNIRTNGAFVRLAGTVNLVNPATISLTTKGQGSITITKDPYHGPNFFNWTVDYRAWPSKKGSTITVKGKYQCFDGTKDDLEATVSGICAK